MRSDRTHDAANWQLHRLESGQSFDQTSSHRTQRHQRPCSLRAVIWRDRRRPRLVRPELCLKQLDACAKTKLSPHLFDFERLGCDFVPDSTLADRQSQYVQWFYREVVRLMYDMEKHMYDMDILCFVVSFLIYALFQIFTLGLGTLAIA